jgi:hypothetical protein
MGRIAMGLGDLAMGWIAENPRVEGLIHGLPAIILIEIL